MHEYTTVSASSYDPAALASKLTDKSAEGWEVVGIVPTGSEVTAFLRRAAGQAPAAAPPAAAEVAPAAAAVTTAPTATEEPSGWALAPEDTSPAAPATVIASTNDSSAAAQAAPAAAAADAAVAGAAAQPATPAGWYHDPSSRYELRYWDGSQWTEHVARGGQQYTDPPVA